MVELFSNITLSNHGLSVFQRYWIIDKDFTGFSIQPVGLKCQITLG